MAANKENTPKPQPKQPSPPGKLHDLEKRDKGGANRVTSDQAPPPRPKKG